MKSVKVEWKSVEGASRKELIIRFFWSILVNIVLGVIGMISMFAWMVQFLHILVKRKRHAGINRFIAAYAVALANLNFYAMLVTDERPPIVPEF